jgi:hypothetical protein
VQLVKFVDQVPHGRDGGAAAELTLYGDVAAVRVRDVEDGGETEPCARCFLGGERRLRPERRRR